MQSKGSWEINHGIFLIITVLSNTQVHRHNDNNPWNKDATVTIHTVPMMNDRQVKLTCVTIETVLARYYGNRMPCF